jgi:PAS domain-containing protein
MLVTLLTSGFALFLMCAVLLTFELITFRKTVAADVDVLARILSLNSTAALAFANEEDATEVLSAVSAEQEVIAAAIYDSDHDLFATYRSNRAQHMIPPHPERDGHHFEGNHLRVFQPILQDGRRIGTIYLLADLAPMYSRFWVYGASILAVSICSALGSLALSSLLHKRISTPILELAEVSRAVSGNEDCTVRAKKYGEDELGRLTDAFNTMLARIGESRSALAASEERLRLALEGSKTGTWDWNLATGEVVWDHYMYPLFGHTEGDFAGTLESVIEVIHPDDRAELERQLWAAVEYKTELNITFRAIAEDGAERFMISRGRAFSCEWGQHGHHREQAD